MKQTFYKFTLPLLLLLAACSPGETAVSTSDNATDDVAVNPVDDSETEVVDNGGATHTQGRLPASKYADYEIITLLPRDAIPAIDNPQFISADEADGAYDPDELILGVEFNGEARAYSIPFLSGHEIVNDTVGGVKIAVTW